MALRKTKTGMHDTYIYTIHIYVPIVNFNFIDLRNDTGFSHEHLNEHVMRFNGTWLILYNYSSNIILLCIC